MKKTFLCLAFVLLSSSAFAQSSLFGLNLRLDPQNGVPPTPCTVGGHVCLWYDSNAALFNFRLASGADATPLFTTQTQTISAVKTFAVGSDPAFANGTHFLSITANPTIGANGGAWIVTAANGGPADAAHTGGIGGVDFMSGGTGGAASATQAGGLGGAGGWFAGNGGPGTATAAAGQGGAATIGGGFAGAANGGPGGFGGDVAIQGGSGTGGNANGRVLIGTRAALTGSVNICDSTGVLLGFFGVTPVVRQTASGEVVGFTAGAGATVDSAATFTGGTGPTAYTIGDLVKALKTYGLLSP